MISEKQSDRSRGEVADWCIADPASQGVSPAILTVLDEQLRTRYTSVNGMVIVRNGAILFERYRRGYSADTPQNVASVTKSVISALIGAAIDDGYISGVKAKVWDFFPEEGGRGGQKYAESVTIEHLLTMTAPFVWGQGGMSEPLDRLRRQANWVPFILSLMGKNPPPGKFSYNSIGYHLLSAIISRATGMSTLEYANRRLFRPIGMREIAEQAMTSFTPETVFGRKVTGWISDPQGYHTGGWGLTLAPRDMARLGMLYLHGGELYGQRILSPGWIEASTRQQVKGYGYGWWMRGYDPWRTFFAAGAGGSHIYCTPEKNLIVTITSQIAPRPHDRWPLLEKSLFPLLID